MPRPRPQPLIDPARRGPFDIIGDVHGCAAELAALLARLGYGAGAQRHPEGRTAVFVGDLVDRGPDTPGVLRRVMAMVAAGSALAVLGNHDAKLLRWLDGRAVAQTHGLAESAAQLGALDAAARAAFASFLAGLPAHLVLDAGALVVAHAGLAEALHGADSGAALAFALFGPTTGGRDANGLPERIDWAASYRGAPAVVHGHTPVPRAGWRHNTCNVDTGCVFGGSLTALRYPERALVSVAAARAYAAHPAIAAPP